ncbi:reverse transcriptase domain-containing protein [Nanoarchaeota archaeon]
MKTHKNLYKKLCSYENLFLAYTKARKGKSKKQYVKEFENNLRENLLNLREELISQTYQPSPLKKFIVRDPKTRKIFKSKFRDRIVHHAIVNLLEPIYEKKFIHDSYASRKTKGQHKAIQRFDVFKRKVSQNGKKLKTIKDNNYICGYVLKADIKHYFQEVNHRILISIISKTIKDGKIIFLIWKILKNYKEASNNTGMPLGNYTSQFFANVYLNELDQFIKNNLKVKYYIRYVDDFAILHSSKEQLEIFKNKIKKFLTNRLKIELHKNKSKIIPLHAGISFLGFRIFFYYKLLTEKNILQIKRNIILWKKLSEEKFSQKLQGWIAHAKYSNSYILINKLVRH